MSFKKNLIPVLIDDLFRRSLKQQEQIERLELAMSKLSDSEAAVEASEAQLEIRVKNHEDKDAQVSAGLQAQIDALKAGDDSATVAAALDALKSKVDNFDPDAPVSTDTPAPVAPAQTA